MNLWAYYLKLFAWVTGPNFVAYESPRRRGPPITGWEVFRLDLEPYTRQPHEYWIMYGATLETGRLATSKNSGIC